MKAVCIDSYGYEDRLTQDAEYDVIKIEKGTIWVQLLVDSPFNSFDIQRFKLLGVNQEEIEELKEEIDDLESEVEDLENQIYDLEREIEDKRKKLESMGVDY